MKRNVFFLAALTCVANLYAVEPVDTAKAVMLQDVQVNINSCWQAHTNGFH